MGARKPRAAADATEERKIRDLSAKVAAIAKRGPAGTIETWSQFVPLALDSLGFPSSTIHKDIEKKGTAVATRSKV